MDLCKAGFKPSSWAPAEQFTGTVRRDPLVTAVSPGRVSTGLVTFEPGARTAWHHHPAGQILYITAGAGWVQAAGGPKQHVTPGDCVWIAPFERHWHGATSTTAMTHLAVTEYIDGHAVTWMEHVADDDFVA
jgi:quercetin dioxygenase-like cupin family protein